jgi:L-asparaginase II
MIQPALLCDVTRGPFVESRHHGHAVICDARGDVVAAWGDADAEILPRSSCKMVQALPLLESGAADDARLGPEQLALACASHNGAHIHTDRVTDWLKALDLNDDALRCGPQRPDDPEAKVEMIRAGATHCQVHNNCSGKHAGFLTLNRRLGGGAEYHEPDHPVQRAVRDAFEEVTQERSPGYGIDGCSAPNFACTLRGLARAMAGFATAGESDARGRAQRRLYEAMVTHPALVAGEGRACTALMRAARGRAAVKTGAEGVFVAILPERGLGVALKVSDGTTRAAEAAITAILAGLGALDEGDPVIDAYTNAPLLNRRGAHVGEIRAAEALRGRW